MAGTVEVGRIIVKLIGDNSSFLAMMNEAQRATIATAEAVKTLGGQMSAALSVPLAGIGALAIKSFAEFDHAMTQSLAIMDVTTDQTQRMTDKVMELASKAPIGPDKLARSFYYLASAGLSTEQAIAAIPAVVNFAVAGMFNLETATTLAADAQSALGLKVKEPVQNMQNLVKVTDVLVRANILANANVLQFSRALSTQAGAAIKVYNKDIEEGVAVLAAFADQGIKSQVAGTSLSRALRFLAKSAKDNAIEHKILGFSVFDNAGRMRHMADIMENLEQILGPMSTELRSMTIRMMGFDARTQQAILPLIGMSGKIREYDAALRRAGGDTDTIANKQMDSFVNQMLVLKNLITIVGIDIGRILVPSIKALGQVLQQGVEWWRTLSDSNKQAIVLIGGVVAALGPIILILGLIGPLAAAGLGTLVGFFLKLTYPIRLMIWLTKVATLFRLELLRLVTVGLIQAVWFSLVQLTIAAEMAAAGLVKLVTMGVLSLISGLQSLLAILPMIPGMVTAGLGSLLIHLRITSAAVLAFTSPWTVLSRLMAMVMAPAITAVVDGFLLLGVTIHRVALGLIPRATGILMTALFSLTTVVQMFIMRLISLRINVMGVVMSLSRLYNAVILQPVLFALSEGVYQLVRGMQRLLIVVPLVAAALAERLYLAMSRAVDAVIDMVFYIPTLVRLLGSTLLSSLYAVGRALYFVQIQFTILIMRFIAAPMLFITAGFRMLIAPLTMLGTLLGALIYQVLILINPLRLLGMLLSLLGTTVRFAAGGFLMLLTNMRTTLVFMITLLNPIRLVNAGFALMRVLVTAAFGPIGVGIMLAAAAIGAFSSNMNSSLSVWDNLKAMALSAWQSIRAAVNAFWEWSQPIREAMAQVWEALWGVIVAAAEAAWAAVVAGFDLLKTAWETVLSAMGLEGELTWEKIKDGIILGLHTIEFTIRNFGQIWQYIWTMATLEFVTFGNQIEHFFTEVIPAAFNWFSSNWRDIFRDLFNYSITVISNLGGNIVRIFRNLGGLIRGRVRWDEVWRPLGEGFERRTQELVLPRRQIGEMEQQLRDQVEEQGQALDEGFNEFRERKLAEMNRDRTRELPFTGEGMEEEALRQYERFGEGLGANINKGMGKELGKFDQALMHSAEAATRIAAYNEQLESGRLTREGKRARDATNVALAAGVGVGARPGMARAAGPAGDRQGEVVDQLEELNERMREFLQGDFIRVQDGGLE